MSLPDLSVGDASSRADLAEPPAVLSGTRIASGTSYILLGVTDDGWVIYWDSTYNTIATKLDGSTTVTVADSDHTDSVKVFGNVVVVQGPPDQTTNLITISTWVNNGGLKTITTSAPSSSDYAVAGTRIIFVGDSTDDETGTLKIADLDGTTNVLPLKTNFRASGACDMIARSAGTTFFVANCAAASPPDAGSNTLGDVSAYAASAGTAKLLFTNVLLDNGRRTFDISKDGSYFGDIVDDAGTLKIITSSGVGAATTADTAVRDFFFTADDGTKLVSIGNDSSIRKWASGVVTALAPANTVAAAGSTQDSVARISNDKKWGIYYKDYNDATYSGPLILVNHETPAAPVSLTTEGFAIDFSSDSTRSLFLDMPDSTTYTGPLTSTPVAGGAGTGIDTDVWDAFSVGSSKVLTITNVPKDQSTADFKLVPQGGGAAVTIVTSADYLQSNFPLYVLSSDKTKLVYSYQASTAKAGIYVYNIQ